jgi:hypothetical protein
MFLADLTRCCLGNDTCNWTMIDLLPSDLWKRKIYSISHVLDNRRTKKMQACTSSSCINFVYMYVIHHWFLLRIVFHYLENNILHNWVFFCRVLFFTKLCGKVSNAKTWIAKHTLYIAIKIHCARLFFEIEPYYNATLRNTTTVSCYGISDN